MARYIDLDKAIENIRSGDGMPSQKLFAECCLACVPTADVVPKSEVEKLEQDVARLVQEKDALIKNYAECMRDYAREIFEEIENAKYTILGLQDIVSMGDIDELKKKYTERCPDCKHFVGCECFDGKTCDEYEEGEK